jgi:HEAT repeat protein
VARHDPEVLRAELVPLLSAQLQSNNDEALYWTLLRIGRYGVRVPAWLPRLIELIDSKHDNNVRINAVRAIGELGPVAATAASAIERLLTEPQNSFPAKKLAGVARASLAKIRA